MLDSSEYHYYEDTIMKATLFSACIIFSAVITVCAADSNTGLRETIQSVEQKKSEIVQHVKQKIARDQEELACVQSATSHVELKSCHDKFRPPQRNDRQENRQDSRPN